MTLGHIVITAEEVLALVPVRRDVQSLPDLFALREVQHITVTIVED